MNSARLPSLSPPPSPAPESHNQKAKRSRDVSAADPDAPKQKKKKSIVDSSSPDRKKKKKDKGKAKDIVKEPVVLPDSQMPLDELDANAQASAAALLSAIMAAAAASPDMLNPGQVEPHYPLPPQQSDQAPLMAISPPYSLSPQSPDPSSFLNLGIPLSDIPFGSNEDVLRTLQDLDISKIADVLKTLGDAAAAANLPSLPPCAPEPAFYPAATTSLQQPPMVGFPPFPNPPHPIHSRRHSGINYSNMAPVAPEQHINPEHAELLCTRWLNAAKLAELAQNEGLVCKKGKFSAIEERCLHGAIENYKNEFGLSDQEIQDIIFPSRSESREKSLPFWQKITSAIPLRPIVAVYHHIRRTYHPLKQQGKWSEEEDTRLRQAVTNFGQQWEKVSDLVGRMSSDCRDRYRNHIQNRELRVAGPWTKEEEEQLTKIVTDMTIKQGKDIDNDVFWGKVSHLMGGRRGRQQCRIKWTDALSKTVKNEGLKPRWNQQDAFILVHKVDSLGVRDDTEIDWKTLSDPDWNLWSAHTLQRRWLTLKRSIKGYENMSHAEIMDILRVKKAHFPPAPIQVAKKRKERKVMSAAAIPDADPNSTDTTRAGSENTAGADVSRTSPTIIVASGSSSDSE